MPPGDETYGLAPGSTLAEIPAPELPYAPADPRTYRPKIALVGCGGISVQHLRAYRAAGYTVAALCDVSESKARERRDAFYPEAEVCTDWRTLLRRDDIEVLDLAAHPDQRALMFGPAIEAGKHILSQKPFVTDLDLGQRIIEKAEARGVRLAVNQNGRWAPHWSWTRQAISRGLLGTVTSARLAVNWDHEWIKGSVFESIRYLILYDFGIHWFDILTCFMRGKRPLRVHAVVGAAPGQAVRPPLLSQVMVEYEGGQGSLFFDASTRHGEHDATYVAGTLGSIHSTGPDLNKQSLTFASAGGVARPALRGSWFPDGFHGTMGELLRAIEELREPENSARGNLESLALCFAAIASAAGGGAKEPGTVRRLPGAEA
jgi:predicted dehydrogenase